MTSRSGTAIPLAPLAAILIVGLLAFMARDSSPRDDHRRLQNDDELRPDKAVALTRLVVGTWTCVARLGGADTYIGRVTFAADGTFAGTYTERRLSPVPRDFDNPPPVKLSGTWSVDGSTLVRNVVRRIPAVAGKEGLTRATLTIARVDFLQVGEESCSRVGQ